jgi:hypothetical protein
MEPFVVLATAAYKDSGFGRLVLACGQMCVIADQWILASNALFTETIVQAQQCCMKQRQLDEFRVSRLKMHGLPRPYWFLP